MKKIPLSCPDISEQDIKAVVDVLRTPHLSLGPKLEEFENKFAGYAGRKYAVAVNSGTSALHLCIKAFEIGDGDEVVTTPFSFIASANCILFERAKPVFADIDPVTLNIDPAKIEKAITKKTKAILPVHVFGVPSDMERIMQIAEEYNLKVIEDSCESVGASLFFDGSWHMAGSFGDAAVYAFYPNKQMTTGEGGMIVTDDRGLADLCRSLRNQGRGNTGEWLDHIRLGYNYRISDINCALGLSQLGRIDGILNKRRMAAERYREALSGLEEDIILPVYGDDIRKISWFVYVVRLRERIERRDLILAKLKENGISCSNYFQPIHLQKFYVEMSGYREDSFPVTEAAAKSTIALPFFNNISSEEISFIAETLKRALRI